MKIPNIKKNSRMQIVLPICVFVLVVIIVLLIIIPSTADSSGKLQSEKPKAQAVEKETEEAQDAQDMSEKEAAECTDSSINDFFRSYYQAMADGDREAMDAMFDEPGFASTSDALSGLLDGYENIRVYTADGFHENELAAFVYSDVKFTNTDTLAPSVDSFYLTTESGEPKIMTVMYEDAEIAGYLMELSRKNPVKSIMENTDFWLETTLKNDENLQAIYNKMQEYIEEASQTEPDA